MAKLVGLSRKGLMSLVGDSMVAVSETKMELGVSRLL